MMTDAPIYILGLNALSYFLAAQLSNKGERVILLGVPKEIKELNKNGVTVREERALQRQKHHFTTASAMEEMPKLLIITASNYKFKAATLLLSPGKLQEVPVLNFTFLAPADYLEKFLGTKITAAYFKGYLLDETSQISLLGRQAEILLSLAKESRLFADLKNLFKATTVELGADDGKSALSFWSYLVSNATVSLLSSAYKKSIYNLIKDKKERLLIEDCANELAELAALEDVKVDVNEVMKEIYNIPNNYLSPMQLEIAKRRANELQAYGGFMEHKNARHQFEMPMVAGLLKDIYNKILV